MARPPRIFVSAGEVSGDRMLGQVLARLRGDFPGMELQGLGGPAAAAAGLAPLYPIARTAFNGAWDVVRNAAFSVRMALAVAARMRAFKPDLVILVDYPGLNLRLARAARSAGFPVHYIAPPQAWAYRDPRRKAKRAARALAGCSVQVLFPFEAEYFAGTAAKTVCGHFFGAPSVPERAVAGAARSVAGAAADGAAPAGDSVPREPSAAEMADWCLCPGSRLGVVRRNLPIWLDLLEKAGDIGYSSGVTPEAPVTDKEHVTLKRRVTVLIPQSLEAEVRELLRAHGGGRFAGAEAMTDPEAALAGARRAIAFPGTMTLELALRGLPAMVIAVLDPLTYRLGRRVVAGPCLALPNLLLGEELFPEWVGTAPGPDAAGFRSLAARLDALGAGTMASARERLRARIGPASGAEAAHRECLGILRATPKKLDSVTNPTYRDAHSAQAR